MNTNPLTTVPYLIKKYASLYCVLYYSFSTPSMADTGSGFALPKSAEIDRLYVFTSFYTKHFDPQPEHVNDQEMIGIEARMTDKWMYGLVLFDNSFGQESEYIYTAYKWGFNNSNAFDNGFKYIKLSGGLMHGYRGEYKDKIPLNDMGVAPAIIPTMGYQYKNFITEVSLGGTSVFTITAGFSF